MLKYLAVYWSTNINIICAGMKPNHLKANVYSIFNKLDCNIYKNLLLKMGNINTFKDKKWGSEKNLGHKLIPLTIFNSFCILLNYRI